VDLGTSRGVDFFCEKGEKSFCHFELYKTDGFGAGVSMGVS